MIGLGVAFAMCAALGVLAYVVADALRVPGILLYLVVGVVLGPGILGVVPVAEVQRALPYLMPLAASIIVFEGALSLDLEAIRSGTSTLRRLLTVGVAIAFLGAAALAWFIGALDAPAALLFGALMVVTGPTVVLPILRGMPLEPRVRALLHWEAILVDPIGVVLAVATLSYVMHASAAGLHPLRELGFQLFLGGGIGAVVGIATSWLLHRPFFDAGGRPERANFTAFAGALIAWIGGELVVGEGGIVAVTTAGLVLASSGSTVMRRVNAWGAQVTSILVASLFVLLAASVDPAATLALGWRGVAVIAGVALVVRPLALAVSTWGSELGVRERLYLAWIGPKGIIAAAVAALSAIQMRSAGIPGGEQLEGLVFGTIAATVLAQGLSARPLARWMGLDQAVGGGVLLVAGPLGPPLGRVLTELGIDVVVLDTNEEHVRRARQVGVPAVLGSALDRELVERQFEDHDLGALLAVTPNEEVNALAAAVGREVLGPSGAYRAAVAGDEREVKPLSSEDRLAFLEPIHVLRVADDLARGDVSIVAVRLNHGGRLESAGARYPMVRVRGRMARIVVPSLDYVAGDLLVCLERRADASALQEPSGEQDALDEPTLSPDDAPPAEPLR